MHPIDTAGAVGGEFVDKDPAAAIPGTIVDAAWLNAMQGEPLAILEEAGIAPVKGTHNQVLQALKVLAAQQISTIANLRTVAPVATRRVYLKAHTTEGDEGGGVFRGVAGAAVGTYVDNVGTIIVPTGGDGSAAWLREYAGEVVNVRWFGARGEGVDDTAAMQAAHAAHRNIYYPAGNYVSTQAIDVLDGTTITGSGGRRFAPAASKTVIRSSAAGAALFRHISTDTGQLDGLSVCDCHLVSDYPITLNDRTTLIADGGASPYLMRSRIQRMTVEPITNGAGIGIALSKCFDYLIEQVEIANFDVGLLLQGCDLGCVTTNRLTGFYSYGILELSSGTFGSQTVITNNDIVHTNSATGVFILTTSRHVRILNNYLEQGSGSCKGFIDISATGAPTYGTNSPSSTRFLSVVVEQNRLDGHALATDYVYRYEPVGLSVTIKDVSTSGPASSANWLTVEGGDGLPLFFSTGANGCMYDIAGGTQVASSFHSLRTREFRPEAGRVGWDVESLLALNRGALQLGLAHQHVRLLSNAVLLLQSLGSALFHAVLPAVNGINNLWLVNGVVYTATVLARARSGTPTLRVIGVVDSAGVGAAVDTVLGAQISRINVSFTGVASTSTVGLAFQLYANPDDVEILGVSYV